MARGAVGGHGRTGHKRAQAFIAESFRVLCSVGLRVSNRFAVYQLPEVGFKVGIAVAFVRRGSRNKGSKTLSDTASRGTARTFLHSLLRDLVLSVGVEQAAGNAARAHKR